MLAQSADRGESAVVGNTNTCANIVPLRRADATVVTFILLHQQHIKHTSLTSIDILSSTTNSASLAQWLWHRRSPYIPCPFTAAFHDELYTKISISQMQM